ncbi:type I restriction endonuclease subunit R [Stenotrophomonas sp. MH181796]|uniref:type I restriction endonuclease subunit R n=1 Tax=Stenotrophomonas sp. MH181796 TaxID=2339228 RepID=UPI00129CC6F0|nr:type I restriction endonuclease subunit R [Stenotrophomonas sp. MH181796]MRI40968.1 type I restriction endonuclease subunit R [Stenotrophomonas sp. MH181796]
MNARGDYSEDGMIQKDAAAILGELGWSSIHAQAETEDRPHLTGRNNFTETVLKPDLRAALERLNPGLPEEAYQQAIDQATAHDHAKTLVAINQDKYELLRNGALVRFKDGAGRAVERRLRLVDFVDPDNNSFKAVRELWVRGRNYLRRADLVGFVNGLPLVFVELKRFDVDYHDAYKKNYRDYRGTDESGKQAAIEGSVEQLFHWNQFVVFSNGHIAKYGSITATPEHHYQWKRLDEDDPEPGKSTMQLPLLLRGMMDRAQLLDIVENFILFDTSEGGAAKIVARNHQYLGVNRVIARLQSDDDKVKAELAKGQLGVFWHTQGSGKSYSIVFLSEKIRRRVSAGYTFVVVTDRSELDDQIAGTYTHCGRANAKDDQAQSGASLRAMLRDSNRSHVFTLIQKYRERVTEPYSERGDIIVISDEAHRSQYGRLALNMRKGLPNAKFIGFTGTPLIEAAEKQLTREVFGDYVSVYDFQRAVADGATLPLKYENHGEKLKIVDDDLNEKITRYIEEARLDSTAEDPWTDEKEDKLYRKLAREYTIFTSPTRLDAVAEDFVKHYSQRRNAVSGGNSKALMVCIDKITCVKMYDLIADKWKALGDMLKVELLADEAIFNAKYPQRPLPRIMQQKRERLEWMRETEFCVVVSSEQGEVEEFTKWTNHRGEPLDIAPHRAKMTSRNLEQEFKKAENPFRVAIVCAMWLTGFDVKSLATLYLDKPMRGHTLMQAIARVNRVGGGKANGLIIDYNGMIKSLRKALATFAQGDRDGKLEVGEGEDPGYLEDDAEGIAEYAASIEHAAEFLADLGFELQDVIDAQGMDKGEKILEACDLLAASHERRKTFMVIVEDVAAKYRGLFPNPGLFAYDEQESALNAIYNKLQAARTSPDITRLLQGFYDVVDLGIGLEQGASKAPAQFDLSTIDFDRLRAEFQNIKQKNLVALNLMEKIEEGLKAMVLENPTRIDLYEKFQRIVAEYNTDKDEAEIQKVMGELFATHDEMDEEARRFQREGLETEQQLAVFDLLRKKSLSRKDREAVKKAAVELLARLEERNLLMGHLRDMAAKQAQLRHEIENHLWDSGMADMGYSEDEVVSKGDAVFAYLFAGAASGSARMLH